MNRSNIGNIATNAIQTLSVTGTTAAGFKKQAERARIADASSGLNNLTDEELSMLGEARADKMRASIAENIESKLGDDVDTLMDDDLFKRLRSPQSKELKQKVQSDLKWYKDYMIGKNLEEEKFEKRFSSVIKSEKRIKERRGESTDADD